MDFYLKNFLKGFADGLGVFLQWLEIDMKAYYLRLVANFFCMINCRGCWMN